MCNVAEPDLHEAALGDAEIGLFHAKLGLTHARLARDHLAQRNVRRDKRAHLLTAPAAEMCARFFVLERLRAMSRK